MRALNRPRGPGQGARPPALILQRLVWGQVSQRQPDRNRETETDAVEAGGERKAERGERERELGILPGTCEVR